MMDNPEFSGVEIVITLVFGLRVLCGFSLFWEITSLDKGPGVFLRKVLTQTSDHFAVNFLVDFSPAERELKVDISFGIPECRYNEFSSLQTILWIFYISENLSASTLIMVVFLGS